MFDDENYVDPEVDGMDPGGSVEAPLKRTRAPRTPKAKVEPVPQASEGAYYLLVGKGGNVVTYTADPVEVRKAAAQAILEPDHTLYRAEVVTPDSVFQK